MKKFASPVILLLILNFNALSQKTEMHFSDSGNFKIVQFTDLHIIRDSPESVFKLIKNIIDVEKPNLVVLTGDITCQDSIETELQKLANIFAESKTYWAAVLGNHDDEWGPARRKLAEYYQTLPYNINSYTPDIKGETNFIIPIAGKRNKNQALLYFFDSNSYNNLGQGVKSKYGWIDFSQINWYRTQSAIYTKNNNGKPIPALSFFHIPIPEYKDLWQNDSTLCVGTKLEDVSCPQINSGLYASMLECGDIFGTFVGHDHINDYIGSFNGIALAYGRFSGGKNTYSKLTPGARIIIMKEDKREFETWIRERGGAVVNKCQFPNSFVGKKK